MTIEEKINKLQAELDELKAEASKKEVKEWNWVPEFEEDYWAVDNCGYVAEYSNDGHTSDDFRIKSGNCFKTAKEADQYFEYLTVLQELRVFAREKNGGEKLFSDPNFDTPYYYLDYDNQEGRVSITVTDFFSNGLPMFINKNDSEEAIKHFGDRLKILFTYNL